MEKRTDLAQPHLAEVRRSYKWMIRRYRREIKLYEAILSSQPQTMPMGTETQVQVADGERWRRALEELPPILCITSRCSSGMSRHTGDPRLGSSAGPGDRQRDRPPIVSAPPRPAGHGNEADVGSHLGRQSLLGPGDHEQLLLIASDGRHQAATDLELVQERLGHPLRAAVSTIASNGACSGQPT